MQKFIDRLKLIGKEIVNIVTNILIPLWGVVMLVAEVFGLPANVLEVLKKIEYVLYHLAGTKEDIDQLVDENNKNKLAKK